MPWSVKNLVFHDKPVPLSNQRSLGYECFARSATTAVQMSAQPGMCRDELAGGGAECGESRDDPEAARTAARYARRGDLGRKGTQTIGW